MLTLLSRIARNIKKLNTRKWQDAIIIRRLEQINRIPSKNSLLESVVSQVLQKINKNEVTKEFLRRFTDYLFVSIKRVTDAKHAQFFDSSKN